MGCSGDCPGKAASAPVRDRLGRRAGSRTGDTAMSPGRGPFQPASAGLPRSGHRPAVHGGSSRAPSGSHQPGSPGFSLRRLQPRVAITCRTS
jgi:hypothetical protein